MKLSNVQYTLITEVFDWSPVTTKIILHFDSQISSDNIEPSMFIVKVIKTHIPMNSAPNFEKVAVEFDREVIQVYTSDHYGNETTMNSNNVTLELKYSPTMRESRPVALNPVSMKNEYCDVEYKVSMKDNLHLFDQNRDEIEFSETSVDNERKHIKLIVDNFVHNLDFEHKGVNLKYAYYKPENSNKKPIIIWLHGMGEGGTDTEVTLANKATNLATSEIQKFFGKNGAYVLLPQTDTFWMDTDGNNTMNVTIEGSDGKSHYTEALFELIDKFVKDNPDIDATRIYLGGCSNGGYMTVKLLAEYSNYFTAAFPICAAYSVKWLNEERLERLRQVPIWFTHSKDDVVVPVSKIKGEGFSGEIIYDENGEFIPVDEYTSGIFERIKDSGNKYYSLYDCVVDKSGLYLNEDGEPYKYNGHFSWIYTLNNDCVEVIDGKTITIFEWLSHQKLSK